MKKSLNLKPIKMSRMTYIDKNIIDVLEFSKFTNYITKVKNIYLVNEIYTKVNMEAFTIQFYKSQLKTKFIRSNYKIL